MPLRERENKWVSLRNFIPDDRLVHRSVSSNGANLQALSRAAASMSEELLCKDLQNRVRHLHEGLQKI